MRPGAPLAFSAQPSAAKEDTMKLRIRLDELLPAKTAARELPRALRRLESGEAEQLVITNRNEPRAVLITVERYEQLLSSARFA
jgi:prevent-host-death family protein